MYIYLFYIYIFTYIHFFFFPLGNIWRIKKSVLKAAHFLDFLDSFGAMMEQLVYICSRHIKLCSYERYSIGSNQAHVVSWLFSWINCRKRVHIQPKLSTGHSVLSMLQQLLFTFSEPSSYLQCTITSGTNWSTAISDSLLASMNFIQPFFIH